MGKADGIAMERVLTGEKDQEIIQDKLLAKGKAYFDSCMNVDAITAAGFEPIKPMAARIAGLTDTGMATLGGLAADGVFAFFRGLTSRRPLTPL